LQFRPERASFILFGLGHRNRFLPRLKGICSLKRSAFDICKPQIKGG
jgi:hypothetical protein